jgi:dephospho-CoA kinase
MRLIGLTGGIASGKSTVAKMFAALGAKVIDADLLAREVVAPNTEGLARIAERWPEVVSNGQLDRKALGAIVFADPAQRAALDAIVHPLIAAAALARSQDYAQAGERVVLYEAALIVEKNLDQGMHGLVVVSLPEEMQLQRLMEREHLSEAEAKQRIAVQAPLAEKLRRATWVIRNEGGLEQTRAQVEAVWKQILSSDEQT